MITPDEFMSSAPAPIGGNSPWAVRYGADIKRLWHEHAARAPRSVQVHLGPSELGSPCDRQVVGKLASAPRTNHVSDPWPSIVGTALHAHAEKVFTAANTRHGVLRFVVEQRVTPHPEHSGTADLYDAVEGAVVDHKFLGPSSLAKIRRAEGPPRKYVVQLLLYGKGYRALGLPVRRVALAAYPRTAASLAGIYVWERPYTPADDALIGEVFMQTSLRKRIATEVRAGRMALMQVPAAPDSDECFFCPFYRPEATDGGPGCPGTVASK